LHMRRMYWPFRGQVRSYKNRGSSVSYRLFDKRRLAGDAVDAVCQENRVIVHRRQAASHGPVCAARQRNVGDVVTVPYDLQQGTTFSPDVPQA
ncbi:hypothetical protein, partial [Pseudomonas viridiflava]|uniref:hypothetical protein n=1 Tax=Pseudomonas viridiflava TaxID=33069 RepID=UPI0019825D69